jgi:1-aminocyclopropane-1-carboxylate deaminase/D-cysteine desulfhydrase-like pyridoxal-dependent ACC family enzyme
MESHVRARAAACSALMGSRPATSGAFTIVDRTGDVLTEERADGMGAARFMRESEGILLDPHYGIPTFEVAWTLPATAEEPVVLWQTGGIPAAIENLDAGDEHERRVLTPSGSL